ncbi:MAG: DUF6383 domain-containing protein [Tannerellaceae bacterium]|jgi:hypothetical protein|nr:DUF6383 domain-containing protein [Tannerellaceae bacterium]
MNKKFFTLMAGALVLAASFGTANAQRTEIEAGSPVVKFSTFPNAPGGLYQLRAVDYDLSAGALGLGDYVLVAKDGGKLDLDTVGIGADYSGIYGESLWCVSFSEENEGQRPKIDFSNKSTGFQLKVSESDVTEQGPVNLSFGLRGGWNFSATYKNVVQEQQPLYTYFTHDSVLVLGVEQIDINSSGYLEDSLVVYKALASKLNETDDWGYEPGFTLTGPNHSATLRTLLFTIETPKELFLTADEYNTILGTQAYGPKKLTFNLDKTREKNPWTDQALIAKDTTDIGSNPWLTFSLPQNGAYDYGKAVRVDTNYVNREGIKFLDFAYDSIRHNNTTKYFDFTEQYLFKVKYDVSNDSATIFVHTVRDTVGYSVASGGANHPTWWAIHNAGNWDATYLVENNKAVRLQDLFTDHSVRIVTIGDVPTHTKIELGLKGCAEAPTTTLTSIGEDVYIIHNAAGKVLGVPIFTDSLNYAPDGVQWITYSADNVAPKYIPAYQWVVKLKSPSLAPYSQIRLINREFPDITTTIQLYTDATTDLYGGKVNKDSFVPVPTAQKKDKHLGYYWISNDEAKLNTYDLNYLHNLSLEYYLGQSETAGDSTMVVKKTKTQYKFTPVEYKGTGKEINYGYTVATGETIKDLVQLVRVAYELESGSKYLTINENERFALTKGTAKHKAVFLLKTNNTIKIDGKDVQYYALLDTLADGKYSKVAGGTPTIYEKVGISDDNLWAFAQVQKETRTSAFHPSEYSSPLYRRFDNDYYTYGDGQKTVQEPYGETANAPVWLRFTKENNFGNELLFENSPLGKGNTTGTENDYRENLTNKQISFLGIYNQNQYKESDSLAYTFYVDTAYVQRPAAAGGTSFTAKPQYMLALRPSIRQADTLYKIDEGWYEDANGNPIYPEESYTDTADIIRPALVRGFYLFNAQDSVNVGNNDYKGRAGYGGQNDVRLAFVDGIHLADTFYVLPGHLRNYTTARLQEKYRELLWTLDPYFKHYLGDNDHFAPRFVEAGGKPAYKANTNNTEYKYNGKSMVFQFRLITSIVNKDRRFLIETTTGDLQMGPDKAQWVKNQNGVPVISNTVSFYDASTGTQNGSEVFNVLEGVVDGATSNEAAPAVSEVKVISETGAVTILNAAGKTVAISNILGQTVANAALTSDNARIVLPKGIVIVAVEGEPAIKAIVK